MLKFYFWYNVKKQLFLCSKRLESLPVNSRNRADCNESLVVYLFYQRLHLAYLMLVDNHDEHLALVFGVPPLRRYNAYAAAEFCNLIGNLIVLLGEDEKLHALPAAGNHNIYYRRA